MIKRRIFAMFLFVIGICACFKPQLLKYIEFQHLNLYSIIQDIPVLRPTIGIVLTISSLLLAFLKIQGVELLYSDDLSSDTPRLPLYYSINNECKLNTKNISRETLVTAIESLQEYYKNVCKSKSREIVVTSICDIPFIVKFGYMIGYATFKVRNLHYIRSKYNYVMLKNKDKRLEYTSEYIDKKNNELLVTVSSSFQIDINRLNNKFSKMNVLSIKADQIDVDNIISRKDLDAFSKYIIDQMRDKSKDALMVHFILATSSSLAFAIGQRISNTIDKKIVVYQYENSNNDDNRPWGIVINSKSNNIEDSIVISQKKFYQ